MTSDFTIDATRKIYWYYPRYEIMSIPTYMTFKDVNANTIDIYIDASGFIESLLHPIVTYDDNMAIISGLINLAIHFRRFYLKCFSTYSRIFMVYSDYSQLHNRFFIKDYNENRIQLYANLDQYRKECLESNINLLIEVCKYLKDIYFIPTGIEPAVKLRSLMVAHSRDVPIALYSKDAFLAQIPSTLPNAVLFKITKNSRVENIDPVNNGSSLLYYTMLNKKNVNVAELVKISPFLLSTFMALTQCKERNLKILTSANKASSILMDAITNRNMPNSYPIEDTLYDYLKIDNYIDRASFMDRFRAIDIVSQQAAYDLTPESKQTDWMIDTVNNDALKEINDKYLVKTPLNLNDL